MAGVTNTAPEIYRPYTAELWTPEAEPHPLVVRAARLALKQWSPGKAVIMVAIGIAESWLVDANRGDHISYPGWTEAQRAKYRPFMDSDGYLSHGWWQIFLGVHAAMLHAKYGAPPPLIPNDAQARWLHDPENNLKAAAEIETNQGFEAWSVFNGKQYEQFLEHAQAAVNKVLHEPVPVEPPPVPGVKPHVVSVEYIDSHLVLKFKGAGTIEVKDGELWPLRVTEVAGSLLYSVARP